MSPKDRLIQKATLAASGEAPTSVIEAIYNEAVSTKNWEAAKLICNMPDGSQKPVYATTEALLTEAKKSGNHQEVYDIKKIFRKEIYQPVSGPLPKSQYTTQLESLARELMQPNGNLLKIYNSRGNIWLDLPSGNQYNWSLIRKFANLQHIILNKDDFHLYKQYISRLSGYNSNWKSTLHPSKADIYRTELYKYHTAPRSSNPEDAIHFEEMAAINVYTGNNYSQMNGMLRADEQNSAFMHALIASVMAASGIRKLPATVIQDTYRQASVFALQEQIQAAAERTIISISGFVSTSTKQGAFCSASPMNFHYTNVTGIYVAPISQVQHEREFLMLPGQFRYVGYGNAENNVHFFEVEPACAVLTEETASNNSWLSTINSALQWGLGFFADDNDLTEEEAPSPTTPVMPIQKPLMLEQAMRSLRTKVEELNQEKQVDIALGNHLRRYEKAHDLEEQLNKLIAQYFEQREINLQKFKEDCHFAIEDARPLLTSETNAQPQPMNKPNNQWKSLLNWLQFIIQQLIHKVSFGYFFKDLYKKTDHASTTQIIGEIEVQVDSCQM